MPFFLITQRCGFLTLNYRHFYIFYKTSKSLKNYNVLFLNTIHKKTPKIIKIYNVYKLKFQVKKSNFNLKNTSVAIKHYTKKNSQKPSKFIMFINKNLKCS